VPRKKLDLRFKLKTMNSIKIAFLSLAAFLLMNCNESAGTQASQDQPAIKEIPAGKSIRTSDIIRNPVTASGIQDSSKVAQMTFEETEYDFGEVDEGATVTHKFKFKNTGKSPLLIGSARSTCGCTIPKWPREPILPGEGGEISVRFNTQGKPNQQNKPVTINANTLPAETKIYVKGFVNPKR